MKLYWRTKNKSGQRTWIAATVNNVFNASNGEQYFVVREHQEEE